MYQALYRKYRPSNFSDVVGQEHITSILKNELKSGKIFHAYLFTGPRGTGKTSCAKILAKAVNCLNPKDGDACLSCDSCTAIDSGDVLDITEIDAASNNGVDNIRDLKEQVSYTPTSAKYRVYIIDEVHMLSIGAFNALLKTLEEPPSHIVFILATTEVHKLPATILSRCQRFDFHRIPNEAISTRLLQIADIEGFKLQEDAANMIAALSDGGMRDALSTLDLCAARTDNISIDDVMQVCAMAGNDYCLSLADMVLKGDVGAALNKTDELHKNAVDLQRLCNELITHYRNLMIVKTVKEPGNLIVCSPKTLEQLKLQANDYPIEGIVNAINVFVNALDRMSMSDRRTEFETAIVRLCTPQLDSSPSAILDRLERIETKLKYATLAPAITNSAETKSGEEATTAPQNDGVASDYVEDIPEAPTVDELEAPAVEQPEKHKKTAPALNQDADVPFEAWQDVISELSKTAPLMSASLVGSAAYVKDDLLLIDSSNEQFFSLMRNENPIYRQQIKDAVFAVVGQNYRLGPYKKASAPASDPLQGIISKLKELEVPKN